MFNLFLKAGDILAPLPAGEAPEEEHTAAPSLLSGLAQYVAPDPKAAAAAATSAPPLPPQQYSFEAADDATTGDASRPPPPPPTVCVPCAATAKSPPPPAAAAKTVSLVSPTAWVVGASQLSPRRAAVASTAAPDAEVAEAVPQELKLKVGCVSTAQLCSSRTPDPVSHNSAWTAGGK